MELTGEQRALAETVADLLRRHPPVLDPEPGYDQRLWRLLGDIGITGLAVPERFGGTGAGPVEVCIAAEALGRALAPTPLPGSAVLTAQAIPAAGDRRACERLLPPIASGAAIAALAWTGRSGGWDPAETACHATERSGGGWTITGAAHYVLDGDLAEVLITAARLPDGSIGLFEVDPSQSGVVRHAAAAMDQTRRLAVARLATSTDRLLGPGSQALARARDLACIALAAEQAGAAARALELTVSYTGSRIQFGRPIASFPQRTTASRAARASLPEPAAQVPVLAAAAKAYCSQALAQVAAEMVQLHGAIGVTWEYDAHRYFKRAHSSGQLFGSPSAHLARIASAVIDG